MIHWFCPCTSSPDYQCGHAVEQGRDDWTYDAEFVTCRACLLAPPDCAGCRSDAAVRLEELEART